MFSKTLTKAVALASAAACLGMLATASAPADESTTLNGKMYVDLTNIDQESDGVKSAASGTGVDVKRFYIGVTHKFDDVWSVNVTSDFNYLGSDGETQLFIKKAFVQAKLSDAFIARLGSADLPWVPFVEDLCGYRFVENEILDRLKFGTSADWGLNGSGKLADGMLNYSVSVVNGNGYKNPTRSNSVDTEGRLGFMPLDGLTLAAGFHTGRLGKDIQGATPPQHTANRFDALVAYANPDVRVGAEYFSATDWNNVLTATSDKAAGYSLWASYNFSPMWGVFGRGDWAKPNKDTAPDLKDRYFNVGLVTHVRKNIDIAFAYKNERVDGGTAGTHSIGTSNGTIGGLSEGTYHEVGVWAQVVF